MVSPTKRGAKLLVAVTKERGSQVPLSSRTEGPIIIQVAIIMDRCGLVADFMLYRRI